MVEGARLESVYRSKAYRGFESLPLRITTLKPNEYDFILVFYYVRSLLKPCAIMGFSLRKVFQLRFLFLWYQYQYGLYRMRVFNLNCIYFSIMEKN